MIFKQLKEINSIFVTKGTQIPYTGFLKEFYQNSKIQFSRNFLKEQKTGEWNYFEETGTIWL